MSEPSKHSLFSPVQSTMGLIGLTCRLLQSEFVKSSSETGILGRSMLELELFSFSVFFFEDMYEQIHLVSVIRTADHRY